jgi:hypothetical protein
MAFKRSRPAARSSCRTELLTFLLRCGALGEGAVRLVVPTSGAAAGQVDTPVRYSQSRPVPHSTLLSEPEAWVGSRIAEESSSKVSMVALHKSMIIRGTPCSLPAVAKAETFALVAPVELVVALESMLSGSMVALVVEQYILAPILGRGVGELRRFPYPQVSALQSVSAVQVHLFLAQTEEMDLF